MRNALKEKQILFDHIFSYMVGMQKHSPGGVQ